MVRGNEITYEKVSSNVKFDVVKQLKRDGDLLQSLKRKYGKLLSDSVMKRITDDARSDFDAHHMAYNESNRVYGERMANMMLRVWEELKTIYKMIPNSPPCPTIDRSPTNATNKMKRAGMDTVVREGWGLVKNKPVVRRVTGAGRAVGGAMARTRDAIGRVFGKRPNEQPNQNRQASNAKSSGRVKRQGSAKNSQLTTTSKHRHNRTESNVARQKTERQARLNARRG